MSEEVYEEKPSSIIPMLQSDLVRVFLIGAAVGALVWALGAVLKTYAFDAYFCQGDITSQCGSVPNYAATLAGIVGAVVALIGLVRLRVYRPLLVVAAATISTWGIVQIAWGLNWLPGLLVSAIFYTLAYGVYSWLTRIRDFWIALLVMAFLVVIVRFALAV